ncbi:MAG: hypothetical protein ACTHJ5_05080 [Ilyomonas sp.]
MRNAVIIIILLLPVLNVSGQKKGYTVKAGDEISVSLPDSLKYIYPQFVLGTVHLRNGNFANALLNYNLLEGEMQFIDPKGDTLAIDNEATIRTVSINKDSFYYDKGYLQLVSYYPAIKLAKRESIDVTDELKMGGYGQTSSTSAITSISSIYRGTEVAKLNSRGELLLLKHTRYFIGDKFNNFIPATKKNIIKSFKVKDAIAEDFLKENKIQFNKEEDLEKLITFLQSQSGK